MTALVAYLFRIGEVFSRKQYSPAICTVFSQSRYEKCHIFESTGRIVFLFSSSLVALTSIFERTVLAL